MHGGGPSRRTRWAGAIGLLAACATSPEPDPSRPIASLDRASVGGETPALGAEPTDPCASTVLCVDKAEARADIDPVAAEADLEACLECPESSPSGYRLLADLARGRRDRAKARRVLLAGLKRFPTSASLALALARLERDEGRVDSALATFARAARAHPRDEVIAREYEAMLAEHGTASQQREAKIQPLLREAAGRFELGDIDGARQTLELALGRASGLDLLSARIHHRLALVELADGRFDAAGDHARRGLELEPADSALRFELSLTLGEIRMAEGHWAQAVGATRAAIEIDRQSPLAWANLSLSLAALGRMDPAIDAFAAAIDRGLSRRLTYAQLSGLGMPFERLSSDPRFEALLVRGWPALAEGTSQTK